MRSRASCGGGSGPSCRIDTWVGRRAGSNRQKRVPELDSRSPWSRFRCSSPRKGDGCARYQCAHGRGRLGLCPEPPPSGFPLGRAIGQAADRGRAARRESGRGRSDLVQSLSAGRALSAARSGGVASPRGHAHKPRAMAALRRVPPAGRRPRLRARGRKRRCGTCVRIGTATRAPHLARSRPRDAPPPDARRARRTARTGAVPARSEPHRSVRSADQPSAFSAAADRTAGSPRQLRAVSRRS